MALRYFLALLCAFLFLRDLGCGEVASVLGALGWAFCDYLVFFLGYPLTPAAAPFPLLLLGLRRLVSRGDRRSVALTVVALLLILTSGHPETLLHCVAGAGIYFLFELGFAKPGARKRPFLLSLLAGALALGLSAVLLLPLLEALPHTQEHFVRQTWFAHARKSFPIWETLRHGATNAMPYLFGVSGKGEALPDFAEPSSYVGSVLWPFAIIGLLSRRRQKWPLAAVGVLGVAMGARVRGIADAVSALPLFDIGLNDRMVFLAAFAVSALAAMGLEELRERPRARPVVIGALAGAVLLTSLYVLRTRWHWEALNMPPGYFRYRFLLQLLPLLLAAGMWLAFGRRGRFELAACAVLALFLAQRRLEEGWLYPTYPSRAFYPPLRLLDPVPRNAPERMTAVGFTFIPNIAALYEVEDVRGYEAMTFKPLFDTQDLWCVPQGVWFNRVDDPTKPFLSFLNVRYVLTPPGHPPPEGWKVLSAGEEGRLLENPRALPRAFVPRSLRYEPDGGRRIALLQSMRDFGEEGVVGDVPPAGSSGDGARANGQASVRIVSYEAQRMTLEVDAAESALVATSVTAWQGWKLTVGGAPAPLLSYNHAVLAFRAPPGRHTAVLRYWPDSFVAGAAISAATLSIGLLLLAVPRLRTGSGSTVKRAEP